MWPRGLGRGIALLFHERGTRREWVVSSTPRPHFTPGKDPVPILQEAGWAPGPVWTSGKSRPHRDSIPDRPARSSVAIPTELPGPLIHSVVCLKTGSKLLPMRALWCKFYKITVHCRTSSFIRKMSVVCRCIKFPPQKILKEILQL